jgi:hypothetical protein
MRVSLSAARSRPRARRASGRRLRGRSACELHLGRPAASGLELEIEPLADQFSRSKLLDLVIENADVLRLIQLLRDVDPKAA